MINQKELLPYIVMGSASRIPESFTEFSESIMSNFDHDIDEKVAQLQNIVFALKGVELEIVK